MGGTLHFSPLLPLTPDWQALAQECSRAYFALRRIEDAINRRDVAVDGGTFWSAHHRLEKAASTIAAWGDPELYGRLLARERINSELEALQAVCVPCTTFQHSQCREGACACKHRQALAAQRRSLYESQPPPPCTNVLNNTPHADCCEQCRNELGI